MLPGAGHHPAHPQKPRAGCGGWHHSALQAPSPQQGRVSPSLAITFSPPTSSSLGAGWRQPQPWPAQTLSSSAAVLPPPCSQPVQPPPHYLSPITKKPRCVSPVLGEDGLARLSRGGSLLLGGSPRWLQHQALPRRTRREGSHAGGTAGAGSRVAPWRPPLAYTEYSAAPCAKPYCILVIFLSPWFEELFSNNSNKYIFFSC